MKSAFISHSWHDKRLARLIADALQRVGGRVWLDDAEIKLGDSLVEKIRAGIDSVDYVVALISKSSVASEWVSKELDIAMNQEIEGRRVKVLPVLASKCSLPGFLKGKLYADMSSPKAIHRSLPMLLERLDAPRDAIAQIQAGKAPKDLQDTRWVADLVRALVSTDAALRYKALKDANRWQVKNLLTDFGALETVFGLLDASNGVHVRMRALALIEGIEDDAFAYRVEPLLNDANPNVVAAAVACLAALKADGSAMRVLGLLRDQSPPVVVRACLNFFSKVEVRDEAVVLSLVAAHDRVVRQHTEDVGLRLASVKALANQLSTGPAVSLLPPVLDALSHGPDAIRLALLELICEKGEELWIPYAPNLRESLGRAVIGYGESSTPQVAAASWLAMLLLPDVSPVPSVRKFLWKFVGAADEDTLACWFERLSDYRLEALFDQEEDVSGLGAIVGRFGGRFDEDACDALCDIGSRAALTLASATTNYEPKGWTKVSALRALARIDTWDSRFYRLLDAAKRELPKYIGTKGEAWALLADFKAARIDAKMLSESFPTNFENTEGDERDLRALAELVNKLKKAAGKRPEARRLATVLKNLDP